MEKESVGQRFMQLIQQLGLSKNAFAMSLDKTATVIQHLVDERNKPGYDLICKVFEVYPNVSKDWLLLGDGPMLLNAPTTSPPIAAALVTAPVPAKPLDMPAAAGFPAPLFTVSAARPPVQAAPAPLPAEAGPLVASPVAVPQAPVAIAQPAPDAAPAVLQPEAVPAPSVPIPSSVATPPAPDATYLTAALHAQYLQHQLALAEQRNQHLLAQQQLMQQMLDLLKRPA